MTESFAIGDHLVGPFIRAFGANPSVFRSPGRINLIGEHTDYNEGFVLPAAIDRFVYVGVSGRDDDLVRIRSTSFDTHYKGRLSELSPSPLGWPNNAIGVAALLIEDGRPLKGFDLLVSGDLPMGAGLSSSAAFSCATLLALDHMFGLSLSRDNMARYAQLAEHRFSGVKCGIMDPFASLFGRKGCFMRLDCRSIEHVYVPFRTEGVSILLLDTNVKHALASSEYNTRRAECERGVERVRAKHPHVQSLRDVEPAMLEECVLPFDPVSYRRCRYVWEENRRLMQVCRHLEEGDIDAVGSCLFDSHEGLKADYEVSCRELDWLVDNVRNDPDVLGARMMGGGFGGCTINLVRTNAVERVAQSLAPDYTRATGLPLSWMTVGLEEGSSRVTV
jgi:galactokinase